ncbi:MAG: RluA family pseudouridine synthase [Bacilli bacterium]|jgi:23S rRNA pseudouridine1911/1915/1917 synthase|nr:RluA family pseudouridine synthase [Bacilli bacterium]
MLKIQLVVEELEEELRVDKYIANNYDEVSRSELKYYFDEEKIFVNNKLAKPSLKVINGDIIDILERDDQIIDLEKEDLNLEVVYEDEHVIVVNKPTGMVVHPAPGHHHGTLVNGLLFHCNTLSNVGGDSRAGIVHRIDKDTSGLLVACKNNKAHRNLAEQFKNKETTTRKYYAIVVGSIGHNLGKINAPIGRDPGNRQKMAVVEGGKDAVTHFKVIERFKDFTLIECKLETGRTHQIRVHMAFINHPVLNDPLYGVKKQTTEFGQYLHAKTLGFVHPVTNEYMEFDSELPDEFKQMLEELRK